MYHLILYGYKILRARLVEGNGMEMKGKDSKKVQFYCLVRKLNEKYHFHLKAYSPRRWNRYSTKDWVEYQFYSILYILFLARNIPLLCTLRFLTSTI